MHALQGRTHWLQLVATLYVNRTPQAPAGLLLSGVDLEHDLTPPVREFVSQAAQELDLAFGGSLPDSLSDLQFLWITHLFLPQAPDPPWRESRVARRPPSSPGDMPARNMPETCVGLVRRKSRERVSRVESRRFNSSWGALDDGR